MKEDKDSDTPKLRRSAIRSPGQAAGSQRTVSGEGGLLWRPFMLLQFRLWNPRATTEEAMAVCNVERHTSSSDPQHPLPNATYPINLQENSRNPGLFSSSSSRKHFPLFVWKTLVPWTTCHIKGISKLIWIERLIISHHQGLQSVGIHYA